MASWALAVATDGRMKAQRAVTVPAVRSSASIRHELAGLGRVLPVGRQLPGGRGTVPTDSRCCAAAGRSGGGTGSGGLVHGSHRELLGHGGRSGLPGLAGQPMDPRELTRACAAMGGGVEADRAP